jgi:hypothetical protein
MTKTAMRFTKQQGDVFPKVDFDALMERADSHGVSDPHGDVLGHKPSSRMRELLKRTRVKL